MHHRIAIILKRLRQDLAHPLDPESILAVWRSIGHARHNTTLNPVAILHCFVTQILHGNTSLEHVSQAWMF